MKRFLLIAGYHFYPEAGTGDWIECFKTQEDAEKAVEHCAYHEYYMRGPRKGEIKSTTYAYKINNSDIKYDWYEIVDLASWIK